MEALKRLISLGFSKYRIAKRLGVHWITVRRWEKGEFNPSVEQIEKMEAMATGKDLPKIISEKS